MQIAIQYQPSQHFLPIEGVDCTHQEVRLENFVTDYMSFSGHQQWESTEPVCQICGDVLERDEESYYEN